MGFINAVASAEVVVAGFCVVFFAVERGGVGDGLDGILVGVDGKLVAVRQTLKVGLRLV